ncbi:AAA family ATPase [Bradyrhizobium sp. HKCCYLRH2015]|uniref:AAA family ATPase n=1 Tax=Bradyrhizobium sp. HKCCYLRH2015 TaxID=3420742 RepID=UPI003EBEDC0F
MDIVVAEKKLTGLSKINVLLGKNGTGKSTLLRTFEQHRDALPNVGSARYITPERGGQLAYDGGIETTLANNPGWADNVRRTNRYENFRGLSVTEYRRLETLVLRKIEKDLKSRQDLTFSFDSTLALINKLLDHVELSRGTNAGFEIKSKNTDQPLPAQLISSGEAELISLAIEILAFSYGAEDLQGKTSYLFLDEPDVHLHPDLQERLMTLLVDAVRSRDIVVLVATHSTAVLGALSAYTEAHVGFISSGQNEVGFVPINEPLQRVLPIFGAHPLSNVFNKMPILLVEGEDDERIWQQAARTSERRLLVWPCAAGDIQSLDKYEDQVEEIAGAIYDSATAFSLRDRDEHPYEINDKKIVKRMRLFCRAAENLILSDDVLASLDTNWAKMIEAIDYWLTQYPEHPQFKEMNKFKLSGYDRQLGNVKSLRNIFMMLAGSQKPWEVAVGQAIGRLMSSSPEATDHSLTTYLGPKLIDALALRPPKFSRLQFLIKRSSSEA